MSVLIHKSRLCFASVPCYIMLIGTGLMNTLSLKPNSSETTWMQFFKAMQNKTVLQPLRVSREAKSYALCTMYKLEQNALNGWMDGWMGECVHVQCAIIL